MDTLSRHTGPYHLELCKVIVCQTKRLSGKFSWSEYGPKGINHVAAARPAGKYADAGRPYRFHYRINVYRKVLN